VTKSNSQSDSSPGDGLKTIKRAASVLRALSESDSAGMRLSDLAAATGLHKATAYRILVTLMKEDLAEQDQARRYHLGAETWILGMAAAPRFDIRQVAAPSLDRISKATGDTTFLSIQSSREAICIDRREGSFPIRTLTLEVGSRRPLGVGAGSLALLAYLPDDEIKQINAANAKALARYPGFAARDLRTLIAETRSNGYSFNDGRIVPGMSAVGVPIFGHRSRPVAALSCAAISERMEPERRATIVTVLQEQARAIAAQINPRSAERVPPRKAAPSDQPKLAKRA
jgi:DNA-binding IclR family transcriptional regulator